MEEVEIAFRESCTKKAVNFSRALETQNMMIKHQQLENGTDRKQFEFTHGEAKLIFEMELLKIGPSCPEQEEREDQERGRQLDLRLVEATRERNRARDQCMSVPMRREERVVIQKMERNLAFQTQHLTTVGKEVLQCRHQLSAREDLYNGRFGADPAVAVLQRKAPKVRRAATYARRLPRLST
jgi:predicted GNAT family acetyltransferase